MNEAARVDMPRWFTAKEMRQNKQAFSYHLSAAEYEALLTLFASSETEKREKSHNKKSYNEK